MKKFIVLYFLLLCLKSYGQKPDVPVLFTEQTPIILSTAFSFREVKKSKSDSVYFPAYLKYKNKDGGWDSIAMEVRARGHFRRQNCFFPPTRLKFKKKNTENTPFAGNKNFKLVLPCQTAKSANELIVKEYLAYKLLEPLTPYYLNTRLVDLELTDSGGKPKTYQVKAFLIEDDDLVANRFDAKVIEQPLHPLQLKDTAAVINDIFQYMIGNTDWSAAMQHNTKVIQLKNNDKIPMAYDFDMAGLVNAPYSTVNETLPISNVQERLYRGFCRNEAVVQYGRSVFLKHESDLMKVIEQHQSYFSPAEFAGINKYMAEFFYVMHDDKRFTDAIVRACRTK